MLTGARASHYAIFPDAQAQLNRLHLPISFWVISPCD